MKKTLISVAAASLMMGTVASADIDVDLGGQAVLYYQTHDDNGKGDIDASTGLPKDGSDLFDRSSSRANAGIQLDATSNLGNGFGAGAQLTALGTLGLEKNLVSGVMQIADADRDASSNDLNSYAFTKAYLTYTLGKTTVKAGRQELPKALSPLAYSESWNVFKNTFDAALIINSDIPDTTVVGAWVATGGQNGVSGNIGDQVDLQGKTTLGVNAFANKGAYMLTVQNKSIPMTTLTGSYYHLSGLGLSDSTGTVPGQNPTSVLSDADAFWLDAKIAGKEMPMGLNIGLQGGQIKVNDALNFFVSNGNPGTIEDTTLAYGAKVGAAIDMFDFSVAYSAVDEGVVALQNVGGVKTPLYTQMILNQGEIASDANTIVLRAGADFSEYGKVSIAYDMTDDQGDRKDYLGASTLANDYTELDLVYKVKVAEINLFAAYVRQDWDHTVGSTVTTPNINGKDKNDMIRFWARYNF